MNQTIKTIEISSSSRTQLINITPLIEKEILRNKIKEGTCLLHVPHTTAGITLNENADPSVKEDILNQLNTIIPFQGNYRHAEGNSAAHIKASIMGFNLSLMVANGLLCLGTWQGIYFCEFDGPRNRKVLMKII